MKIMKRNIAFLLVCTMLLTQGIYIPTAKAGTTSNNAVSIRTTDKDVVVSVSKDSPVTYSSMQEAVNSAVATQGTRVNTTNIDITDLSNWYVYDHNDTAVYSTQSAWQMANPTFNISLRPYYSFTEGYAEGRTYEKIRDIPLTVRNSTTANVVALGSHIDAYNNNGKANMNFYGYGAYSMADFLFYPASNTGVKKVDFNINAKDVRTHSLASAGFLFNSYVSNNKLNGYAMVFLYYSSGTGSAAAAEKITSVNLVKLTDVDVNALHNTKATSTAASNKTFLVAPATGGSQITGATTIKSVPLSGYTLTNLYDVSNITMSIEDSKFSATMVAKGAAASSNDVVKLFENESLVSTGAGGFGPIINYSGIGHTCAKTSSYEFSDLKMSITDTSSVLDSFSLADYTQKDGVGATVSNTQKYFVVIGNNDTVTEDYFSLQEDQAFLELLKKENVVLITNLDIVPQAGLAHANYVLKDYLGEGNVFQIPTDTVEKMAQEINKIINNNTFNITTASAAKNATGSDGAAGYVPGANCYITYNGNQIESINRVLLDSSGITCDIISNPLVVNSSEAKAGVASYTLYKPNGTKTTFSTSSINVTNNATDWPTGTYSLTMKYNTGITAITYFAINASYSVKLNGSSDSAGILSDHVSVTGDTIGESKALEGTVYTTTLRPDSGYQLPSEIKVYRGTTLLTNGTGYTYNSLTGLITIPSSSVTGDINIIADTFNITKTLTGLTATGASQGSSYSGGVVTTLSVAPTKIQVVVNNSTYTLKDGENITFDTTGVIGYSVSAKTVTVTGNSNNKNIEIIANYGVYSAEVSVVNMSNTAFASAVGGTDFSTTITPDRGYSYPTDIEVTVAGNRIMSGYSYDPITGIIIVDGLKITGNLRITAVGVPKTNMVTYNLEELTTDGSTTVTFGEDYTATLTPSIGYHLPDKIEVYLNEELITVGYTYDTSSGFVSIDGNLCDSSIRIKAKGELNQYAVTFKGTNVLIKEGTSGEKKASYHTTYETTLEAAPNYRLPNEIELSMDGKTLINNTDYSYNATTGELVVNNQVIEGDLKITVIGIDNSNPMAGIQIDDKIWDTNKDKLGVVYYNANKTVSFNYEDNSEDICEVSYFISESPVTEYEEIVWIDYDVNSPVVLEHDGRYYIYERVQDQTGNVTYVNSDAIIIDTIQPVLLDVMNGATYYDDILLEISEENLDYIEVDGNRIIVPESGYLLTIGNSTNIIHIVDLAGNEIEYRLTLLQKFEVTGDYTGVTGETPDAIYCTEYHTTISADSYYGLPDDITITVKGKELNKGEGYRYNSTTGEIIINENDVQGSIIIKAVAKDVTAPQACITLNENQWNMEGDTDIIVYYKTVPQIASITATDYGDGIKSIEYGILQMPKSDENPVKWIDYESAKGISIEEDGTYIIYVRVTDYNNNVCFINSSTIMVDSKAPSIEDLIDNGVYYGSKAFVVPDDATQVTVDGVNIEFDQYLIELPADNNEHIIIITDQSGNTMEYRIVLYGEYVISYLPGIDGIGSKLEEVRYGDTSEYKIKDALYTRKGYTQIGWSTRENDKASLYVYGQEYNENSNLTLYPVWKKNVVTVIGNISNSDSLKDTILYGAEYSVTIKPITGYTFPRSVTIKCDNNILKVNEDYEYNPLTGVIKIYLNKAVGNITIIADAVKVINSQVKPDASKIGLVGPTYIDSSDGSMDGVDVSMEYLPDGGSHWIRCTGTIIQKLPAGTYQLRYAATLGSLASESITVELIPRNDLYDIPVISLSKVLGTKKKFKIKLVNTSGAVVTCKSSDTTIATVNKKGLVQTKNKTGSCQITVTIVKGKNIVQYVMSLKVKKGIKRNYSLVKLKVDTKNPSIGLYKLMNKNTKWKISFKNKSDATLTFTNNNKKVVRVYKDGTIKAKKAGKAIVVAKVKKNGVTNKYYVVVRVTDGKTKSNTSYLKVIK